MRRDNHEPGPYGIGSDLWPGVSKTVEEMAELGTVFGKLMGSGGALAHWSGDLLQMMRDEIPDVRASLAHLVAANPVLVASGGGLYMMRREKWKTALFQSWRVGAPPEDWPKKEDFGL